METPSDRVIAENYWIQVINAQDAINNMVRRLEEIKRSLGTRHDFEIGYEVTY